MDGAFSCGPLWLGSLELPNCSAARIAKAFSRKPSAGAIQPHMAAPPVQSPAALKVQVRQLCCRCLESFATECRERVHSHAKPLNQVGFQWSGLNPESKADVSQQALLLLGESSFVLQSNNRSEVFPVHCTAQGGLSPSLWYLACRIFMWGLALGRKGIIYSQTHPITDGASGLPFTSLSTRKADWFEAGQGSSSTGKDFRSRYAALLNLPFDPWGKGQFGSWKAIVCLLVLLKAWLRAGVSW